MNRFTFTRLILLGVCMALPCLSLEAEAQQDRGSVCVFSKEAKPSIHVDPWAPASSRVHRFGVTENADEINIQNCKGANDQFIALAIGTRESSLASDSGNVVTSPDLGEERCEFSPGIKKIPWMISQPEREASIKSRLKTLRSCVALEVVSINGKPLILGNHPSCTWITTGPNTYVARGATCTFKIETTTAVSVKPLIEPSCLTPKRFESGELQPADINTALQAYVTSDGAASSTSAMIGTSGRRIVFAPSPKVVAFDPESELRFPKTINLKIQPTALDITTQRSRDEATSYVTMQMIIRNMGSNSSSYPVPLAAETELVELTKTASGEKPSRTVATWTTFASGQTLVPADWAGLFVTDRTEIPDFAFKQNRRYRLRLKYYHPHDVAGLLQAEFRNRPQNFALNPSSYDIPKYPLVNGLGKVPQMAGYPRMSNGPVDNQPEAQLAASEREILQFFRQLGVDSVFPARYNKVCDGKDDSNCVPIGGATFIGQSIVDFTTESVPGQTTEMRAVNIDSYTKLANDKTPSAVHFEEREGIRCN